MPIQPIGADTTTGQLPAPVEQRIAGLIEDLAPAPGDVEITPELVEQNLPERLTTNGLAASIAEALAAFGGGSALDHLHGVPLTNYSHSQGGPWLSRAGSVFPVRLRNLLHADPAAFNNRFGNGNTIAQIADRVTATWVDGTGGLVTLMVGQNSIGMGVGETAFKASLRSILTTLKGSTGYPPTVLLILDVKCTSIGYARYNPALTDADVNRGNLWITQVAAESAFAGGWLHIADPGAFGYDPVTMTGDDGQHANDHGQALLARACLDALQNTGYRLGLNVGITDTTPVGGGTTPPAPSTVADNFNRADANTLGSTSTGNKPWTALTGTWGIVGNKAHALANGPGGDAFAVVDTDSANGTVTATVSGTDVGEATLLARVTNAQNLWLLYGGNVPGVDGRWTLAKLVGGTYTFITRSADVAAAAGDVLSIAMTGNSIVAKVNGVTVATTTDSHNATADLHGMRDNFSLPAGRLDDWTFTPA